jgi:hypothetical protein
VFSANLAQMAPHCRCGSGISQRRMSYTGVAAGSVGRWHDLPYRQVLQSLPRGLRRSRRGRKSTHRIEDALEHLRTRDRNCGRKKSKFLDSLLTCILKRHLTKALPTP